MTGFDKMLGDKINWFRVGGNWFALFGIANLLSYGYYLVADKDQFYYHFAYTTYPGRLFKNIKSQFGTDNLLSVSWTAPSLILANLYMNKKVGSLIMTKFFFLSLFGCVLFRSTFNPDSGLNFRPLRPFLPKFDSNADDGSYYMGAD